MEKFRTLLIPSLVVLTTFCILMALGVWQIQRLQWKLDLIATVERQTKQTPVNFAKALQLFESEDSIEYLPIELRGEFLNSGERHYFSTYDGVAGWFIFTPLLVDGNSVVFVNRGFVPDQLKDITARLDGVVSGPTSVRGLIRIPPSSKPNYFTPENEPAGNRYFWRDLESMANSAILPENRRVVQFFVDEFSRLSNTHPTGGTTRLNFSNNHLQYAVTWFGLAIVLACVYAFFLRSRIVRESGSNLAT